MRSLSQREIFHVSGGNSDSPFVIGMFVTPDDVTASNFISLSVYGGAFLGGIVGAYCGYENAVSNQILKGILGAAGGIIAGSMAGGLTASFFLSVTQPVHAYIANRFA